MIRGLSGRIVLLGLAILIVVLLFIVRNEKPPKPDDPVAQAQEDMLAQFGFKVDRLVTPSAGGLTVLEVTPGSVADKLGLRKGDVVLAVNERSVWHAQQLYDMLSQQLQRRMPALVMVKNNGVFRDVLFGGGRRGPGKAGGPGAGQPPAGASRGMPPASPTPTEPTAPTGG